MASPQYTHDCKACVFLGHHTTGEDGWHDLYLCLDHSHGWHTVLARYANEGGGYRSFAVDANVLDLFKRRPDHVLAVAYKKALAAGYEFSAAEGKGV